jgi:cob(I)alamin adenosyltransferase
MKTKGLIHLYVGKGRGKTTTAVGLALRAHGAGKKVCFIQFLKARVSHEILMLEKLGVKVISLKERHPLFYGSSSIESLKKKLPKHIKYTEVILKDKKCNFVILDEILYLLKMKLLNENDIINLLKLKPPFTELILTGAYITKAIMNLADYVSTINNTKHPFQKGEKARKGVEL